MDDIARPGSGVLFMKVGTHAQETLEDIIARKSKEIDEAGFAMWGYGGNTCHPRTMVQPFADIFAGESRPIHLVMEAMESKHLADPVCAAEYSVDSINWKQIPSSINVLGSRYALTIRNLRRQEFQLPLNQTSVPLGRCTGRLGSRYISGRVDKACLQVNEVAELSNEEEPRDIKISLVADLVEPYAVFLRNYR